MNQDLEKRIREAMLNPQNVGEMAGADSVGTVGKKEWRQHVRKVVEDPRLVVAEAPAAHVRWLIEEAYQRTLAAGRVPPPEFGPARLSLGPVGRPALHPALALASTSAIPPVQFGHYRPRSAAVIARTAVRSCW